MTKRNQRKRRGRGEGGIDQLPSGRWRAEYRATVNGKKERQSKSFLTKEEALQWLQERRQERFGEWSNRTLGEWCDQFLKNFAASGAAKRTTEWYELRIRTLIKPHLGTIRLNQLTAGQIYQWSTDRANEGDSADKRAKAIKCLRTILKSAVDLEQIATNPALKVKIPTVTRGDVKPLTEEDAIKFLEAANSHRLAHVWYLAIDSGMRAGELLALTWGDIQGNQVQVIHSNERDRTKKKPKTRSSRRTIPIAPITLEKLRAASRGLEPSDPVCRREDGQPMRYETFHHHFNAVCDLAGITGYKPHDLRHTCASLLLARGVNIKVISERLGHSTITITLQHYAHLMAGMQERAVQEMETFLKRTEGAKGTEQSEG